MKPYAIMMMGRSAAGKTTTACILSREIGVEHILIAKYKRQAVNDDYTSQDCFREELREYAVNEAINYARGKLSNGNSVVLDASFHKMQRRKLVYVSLSNYCDLLIRVYCITTSIEDTKRRINGRRGLEKFPEHQASDFSAFEYINRNFEEPDRSEELAFLGILIPIQIDTFSAKITQLPLQPYDDRISQVIQALGKSIKQTFTQTFK